MGVDLISLIAEAGAAMPGTGSRPPVAGAAPTAPTEAELLASLPTIDQARRARRRPRMRTVQRVEILLPTDPAALAAANRLVATLRRILPAGAVHVRAAGAGDLASGSRADAVLDLRGMSGSRQLGRFAMPAASTEQWSLASRAEGDVLHVRVTSGGLSGAQLAVNELLELSGVRALSYRITTLPPAGRLALPDAGTDIVEAVPDRFRYRGMAPHTYHPIELSQALHDPSPRSLQVLRDYIDWNVAVGQNVVHFPLLDVEADNVAIRLRSHPDRRAAWEAHVRELVGYAHRQGVQVVANASFTVFTDAHLRAMGFIGATVDTFRLNGRQHDWLSSPIGSKQRAKFQASYERLLDKVVDRHERRVRPFVQRLEQLGFDELHLNLGTSEFTSPNDDLQLAWIELARRSAASSGDGMRVSVGSHVPDKPTSPRYGVPMFDLHELTPTDVGAHIHTVQVPALTDRADTYGLDTFRNKLKTLDGARADRLETWYPETSYWVQYDVTVPLFLPVYMLTRHRDHRRLLANDRIDGQLTFTTAWEWGYWLNDAAMARMTTRPKDDLTTILVDLLEPLGPARDEAVALLRDVMLTQQRYLVDQGLIRHLQGFDALSSLGETLGKVPGLNKVVHASNNVPQRTGWAHVRRMDRAQLDAFEREDVAALRELERMQAAELRRVQALVARAEGPAAGELLRELRDGIEINLLRTRQVLAALTTFVAARRVQLGDGSLRATVQQGFAGAQQARAAAELVIRRREAAYRESPEDAWAGHRLSSGAIGTMWGKRSLTPVHTLKYWNATVDEARRAVESIR